MFVKYFYKIAYNILRVYWYIFKPKTFGALGLIEFDNKYLLIKNTYGDKVWKLPGGGMKSDELPEETIVREVNEELGIKLHDVTLIKTLTSKAEYKIDTIYIFYSKVNSHDFFIDEKEIEEAGWFNKDKLPKNISNLVPKTISYLD